MAVEVKEGQSVKHDGIIHQAGAIIHNLSEEVKAELIRFGVVKDLEADAKTVAAQASQDAHTIADQVHEDVQTVQGQVAQHAHQDVQAALETLADPGQPVAPTPPEAAALQPPVEQPVAQPTADEIAKTAASVE